MISAVPPKEYGDRFMAFIYSIIHGNDTSKRPKMYENGQVPEGAEKGKEQQSKAPDVPGAEGPKTMKAE
jgi:1-phosphatidylinositol-4-phosphate 5-kinase